MAPIAPFSTQNVLYGSQQMYVAPVDTPDPTIALIGGVVTLDPLWKGVGYTNAGYVFDYSPTFKDINVDETLSPVAVLKTAETLKVTAALSEATLENLNLIISGATFLETAAASGVADIAKITVGGASTGVTATYNFYSVCFVGKNPYGFPRIVKCHRVYSTAKVSMAFKKDSEIMIPVEFTGLADTVRAVGDQLFAIYEKRGNALP